MLTTPWIPSTVSTSSRQSSGWLATAPVWIIAAAASTDARLGLWGAGGHDRLDRHLARPPPLYRRLVSERVEFADEHLMERCRLFLLIALGETVATPGTALATAPIGVQTLAGGVLALAGTLCLWWLHFHAEPLALRHVARTDVGSWHRLPRGGVKSSRVSTVRLRVPTPHSLEQPLSASHSTRSAVQYVRRPLDDHARRRYRAPVSSTCRELRIRRGLRDA